jgi:hypothetical protein
MDYSLKQRPFGSWVVMKHSPDANSPVGEGQVSPDFNSSDEAAIFLARCEEEKF